tara:strand:+ start:1304 stop:2917 length:1614 start_codon:yes stop_codon:yes gene_type:complete
MWGEHHDNQIRLTVEKLSEFQQAVPWQDLSPTFREAFRITSALGYRYIWIDSLCIIQNLTSDWEFEAQRMSLVYGNCIANIAFLFPPDDLRHTRDDPRMWSPCIMRKAMPAQSGVYIRHLHESWHKGFLSRNDDWLDQKQWPLFSRGWTFQEYLLSSRTLLYGHKNLMYQCSHVFYDELLGPIAEAKNKTSERTYTGRDLCKNRYFHPAISSIAHIDSLSSPALLSFMFDWMNTVNEYRTRKLTFATDRSIAFAGIATAYQKLSGMTYLAGVWWVFLPLSLLWFVEKKAAALVRDENPEEFPRGVVPVYTTAIAEQGLVEAPTWSWFRVPIYHFYRTSFLFNDDERVIKGRSLREPDRSSLQDIYSAQSISYQFASSPPKHFPKSGLSYFKNLTVTIKTLTWQLSKDLPTDVAHQMSRIQESNKSEEGMCWEPVFTYYPDLPSAKTSPSPPRHGVFALSIEFQVVRTGGLYHIERRLAGLVLTQSEHLGCLKRVGAWKLKIRIRGVEVKEGRVASVAERWGRYRLTSNWNEEEIILV